MKIDTKYAGNALARLNGSTSGALANILDRIIYDMNEDGDYWRFTKKTYVGKDGNCRWVAPFGDHEAYADSRVALEAIRDELYAIAFGTSFGASPPVEEVR